MKSIYSMMVQIISFLCEIETGKKQSEEEARERERGERERERGTD